MQERGDTWMTSPPRRVIGAACVLLGAVLLIAPHHLLNPGQTVGALHHDLSGLALAVAGVALLLVDTFQPPRRVTFWVHVIATAVLGHLVLLFATVNAWPGVLLFAPTTVLIGLLPFLEGHRTVRPPDRMAARSGTEAIGGVPTASVDLLALVFASVSIVVGAVIMGLRTEVIRVSPYPDVWVKMLTGAGFIGTSLVIVVAELTGRGRGRVARTAQATLVTLSVWRTLVGALPEGNWPGVVVMTATACYFGWRLCSRPESTVRNQSSSLRARLGMSLAIAATVPLLLATNEVAARDEASTIQQARVGAKTLAVSLAHELDEILALHAASVQALAGQPGISTLDPSTHTAILAAFASAYPEMSAFATYGPDGTPIARSDGGPLAHVGSRPQFEWARERNRPTTGVGHAGADGQPLVSFFAPIQDATGSVRGLAVASLEARTLAEHFTHVPPSLGEETVAYLVDGAGMAVIFPEQEALGERPDLSVRPAVEEVLALRVTTAVGTFRSGEPTTGLALGGYAAVPNTPWTVIVERDTTAALAAIRTSRDQLLVALLAAAGVAALLGAIIARHLSAPLNELTRAVEALATDGPAQTLPRGGVAEIARLAGAFQAMRDTLTARTAERAAAEAALAASEAAFRHLAEQAPDVVIRRELRPVDRYTFVSPSVTRVLGYTPEDYYADVGFPSTLTHPGDPFTAATFEAGSRPSAVEVHRLRHKDGHWVWVETRRTLHDDEHGELIGYEAISRDVTERVEHAQAVELSQTRLRMALEAARISFWEVDLQTQRMWRTGGASWLVGVATNDDLGETLDDVLQFVHADDRERIKQNLLRATRVGSEIEHAFRIIRPDGSVRWLAARGRAMRRESDGAILVMGTTMDVTDKVESEAALVAANVALAEAAARAEALARDAEAASRAKSDFLATMSHEIRTPLNGVIGLTALLLDDDLTPGQREDAEMIHASAEALRAIVDDILDFSKIEAGRLDLEVVELSPHDLVDDVVAILAEQARRRGLHLEASLAPDLPPRLHGDPIRLRQILLNLVGNAIKFTESGRVEIAVGLEPGQAGELVRFAVRDTGIGLSEAVQARLFTPFTQADSSTTRQYGGTGLGLAISRRLVELMNGTIGVESTAGKGSVFWFVVPLTTAQPTRAVSLVDNAASSGQVPLLAIERPSLLVVDDNPINRKVAARIGERLGFQVDTAADGHAAVALAAQRSYVAILMDCQMPGLDGFEATAAIRAAEPAGERVPIIALTANAFAGVRDECLAADMDDYVAKPTTVRSVAAVLSRWVPGLAVPPHGEERDRPAARRAG
jgi:PAS domain S-box-containing protein